MTTRFEALKVELSEMETGMQEKLAELKREEKLTEFEKMKTGTEEKLRELGEAIDAEAKATEKAKRELEGVGKTKAGLTATLDAQRAELLKIKKTWDRAVVPYTKTMSEAQELNNRGRSLAQEAGLPFEAIDLVGRYGYGGAVHGHSGTMKGSPHLAVHDDLVPAVYGGDVWELIRARK